MLRSILIIGGNQHIDCSGGPVHDQQDQQLKRRTKHDTTNFVIKMKGKINWPNTEMSIYVVRIIVYNIRDEMFQI